MTQVTKEELAAWADGEVTGTRGKEVAAAVAADPQLQAEVEAHKALKAQLSAHFAPIAEARVPDRFSALLNGTDAEQKPAEVVDFAGAREKREARRRIPRWGYFVGPALAATLVLAVVLPGGPDTLEDSDPALAMALDSQLVADQDTGGETRVLLSFVNEDDRYCRAFSQPDRTGIACRDDSGWALQLEMAGTRQSGTEFRQAGAEEILAAAQDMAAGPALTAEQEAAAREAGWR